MIRVCVKAGIRQLPLFETKRPRCFEAYITHDDTLSALLNTHLELVSIHMPDKLEVGDRLHPINFSMSCPYAEASYGKLEEILCFCNAHNVRFIIMHLGFFDSMLEDRWRVIDGIAQRLRTLDTGKVRLCIENVPRWINTSYDREPIVSTEAHMGYLRQRLPEAGLVLDIDHAAIDSVFDTFYREFADPYREASDKQAFKRRMEKDILSRINRNTAFYESLIDRRLADFATAIDPDIMHVTGSDFCAYFHFDQLPLVGEAIPIGYQGKISGFDVTDRIDHTSWMRHLSPKRDVLVTLELMIREKDYGYIDELERNAAFLKAALQIPGR